MIAHRFTVAGHPVTQGSKTVGVSRNGQAFMREVNGTRLQDWRHSIADTARASCAKGPMIEGAVRVCLSFTLSRPVTVEKRRRAFPIGARSGDVDKLARAALDAMTGVLYDDDAQVVSLFVKKGWAPAGVAPGVEILVEEITT